MCNKYSFLHRLHMAIDFQNHDDVIKWKHFPRYWPFVWGIHQSPVNSPHKDQWRVALIFSLICVWINGWVINRDAGDLRRNRAHYDVPVMIFLSGIYQWSLSWWNYWFLHRWRQILPLGTVDPLLVRRHTHLYVVYVISTVKLVRYFAIHHQLIRTAYV